MTPQPATPGSFDVGSEITYSGMPTPHLFTERIKLTQIWGDHHDGHRVQVQLVVLRVLEALTPEVRSCLQHGRSTEIWSTDCTGLDSIPSQLPYLTVIHHSDIDLPSGFRGKPSMH